VTNIIKELRVNEKIRGKEVRVVGEKGEQLGILTVAQALETANRHNLDLVEVAPTAVPPVCRLMDYGKFKYEQTKKEREARKNQKRVRQAASRTGIKCPTDSPLLPSRAGGTGTLLP
jgi:translation initiation factor IF-3